MSPGHTSDDRAPEVLVVTDLDFTLLRSDATLGDATRAALDTLARRGVGFTYATSRSFSSAGRIMAGVPITAPVATFSGAVIVDPATGIPRDAAVLPSSDLAALLDATRDLAEVEPIVHAVGPDGDVIHWRPTAITPGVAAFVTARQGDPRLAPVTEWTAVDLASVFYVTVIGDRPLLEGIRRRLGPGSASTLGVDPYTREHWLEVHARRASKGRAARRIAAEVGARRIIAFGDNLSDVDLFAVADESYAVANAVPEVHAAATATIGDNDSEAVARWLIDRFG